jgi:Fur family ferric uptake transcriptional regulator
MRNEIEKLLIDKNIKPTAMRLLVLEVILKNNGALSLIEIERQFENVERTTIYRTLKTFQENCIIHSIHDGTGAVRYAICSEGCNCNIGDLHAHFFCNQCGQTICLKDYPIPDPKLPEDFIFRNANFVIQGICPDCK